MTSRGSQRQGAPSQPTNPVPLVTYAREMAEIRMAVIGAGSWGTTVASLAAANTPTVLWARREFVVESINTHHVNPDYIGGVALSPQLRATASLSAKQ